MSIRQLIEIAAALQAAARAERQRLAVAYGLATEQAPC